MALTVHIFPMFSDNYGFLVIDDATGYAALVDPGEGQAAVEFAQKKRADVRAIWNTHHHADHAGGNQAVLAAFGDRDGFTVYAGTYDADHGRIPGVSQAVTDGNLIELGQTKVEVMFVPGHTKGHIAYYADGKLFCGDTLFAAGCGRLFEGTPQMMHISLSRLAALPPETEVYCAHEYTVQNLRFAARLEPDNPRVHEALERAWQTVQSGGRTVPSTIGAELQVNPFLRAKEPGIRRSVAAAFPDRTFKSETEVFAAVRELKDGF